MFYVTFFLNKNGYGSPQFYCLFMTQFYCIFMTQFYCLFSYRHCTAIHYEKWRWRDKIDFFFVFNQTRHGKNVCSLWLLSYWQWKKDKITMKKNALCSLTTLGHRRPNELDGLSNDDSALMRFYMLALFALTLFVLELFGNVGF